MKTLMFLMFKTMLKGLLENKTKKIVFLACVFFICNFSHLLYGESPFCDSDGNLRLFISSEDEVFAFNSLKSDVVLTDSFEDLVVKRIYDDKKRVVCKEFWKIVSDDIESSSVVKVENYSYIADSVKLYEREIKNFDLKQIIKTEFDLSGQPIRETLFSFDGEKRDLKKSVFWKYDSENRIVECEKIDYSKNKKISEKEFFSYLGLGESADYFFYENDKIRIKKIYKNAKDYVETTFLDDGFYVEDLFVLGVKIESNLYLNGRLQNKLMLDE